jgi:hypothetical protein
MTVKIHAGLDNHEFTVKDSAVRDTGELGDECRKVFLILQTDSAVDLDLIIVLGDHGTHAVVLGFEDVASGCGYLRALVVRCAGGKHGGKKHCVFLLLGD